MAAIFSRTVRSLREDGSTLSLATIGVSLSLLLTWGTWLGFAEVRVVETSTSARLESSAVAHPIQSTAMGKVVFADLGIDRRVRVGDLLVELDSQVQRLALEDAKAELTGLSRQLDFVRKELAELEAAHEEQRSMSRASIAMSRATEREAVARSKLAAGESDGVARLREHGIMTELDELRAITDAAGRRAAAEASKHRATYASSEGRKLEHERRATIERLHLDLAVAEGRRAQLVIRIKQLEHEIERRKIRSPIDGVIGEALPILEGSVLEAGAVIGRVVPPGELRVVAEFEAATAMGRIEEGNEAQVRLAGFAWAEHGVLHATVATVSSESRDGRLRVELNLERSGHTPIPVQHGLEGTVEVDVEEVSPLVLLLRAAGAAISPPSSSRATDTTVAGSSVP